MTSNSDVIVEMRSLATTEIDLFIGNRVVGLISRCMQASLWLTEGKVERVDDEWCTGHDVKPGSDGWKGHLCGHSRVA